MGIKRARLFALGFVVVALVGQLARTAELVTAETDGIANDVIVQQGGSTNFNIALSATGAIKCAATSTSPATAQVATVFSLSASGSLTAGTLSAAKDFFGTGTCSGNNRTVTWTGAPVAYSVPVTVSANTATPLGDYTIVLSVAAGTTVVTSPAGQGGTLADAIATSITVHVVAPPPPPDSTPPEISASVSPAPNAAGWNNTTPVTVSFTVIDNESAITAQDITCTSPVTFTAPTNGIDVTCSASSAGGNASKTVNVKIDATGPDVAGSAVPGPNIEGWNNSDVDVSFIVADAGAPIVSTSADCAGATLSGETAGTTLTCVATNAADLSGQDSVTVKIDKTQPNAPTANVVPAPNSFGWNNTTTTVTFTSNGDPGPVASGVLFCTGSVEVVGETTIDGSDVSGVCVDKAGNPSLPGSATVYVDKTAPGVTVTGVANGGVYGTGSVPAAGCITSDSLSGVQTEATLTIAGGGPNGTGTYTATCSGALDKADNPGSASVTYTVNYGGVSGILAPLNNPVTMSRGKTVPVKWKLAGDEPSGFNTTGWQVLAVPASCSGEEAGSGTEAESQSASGLRYDASADQYIFNANMSKQPVGSCWKMRVQLNDPAGTKMESSVFKLQK